MILLQCDFEKYSPETLNLVADQIRSVIKDEIVLVIPQDINFIRNLTEDQLEIMKKVFEKELEARKSNGI